MLFFLLAVIISCDSVRTEYDSRIDFSQYKTFCWMDGCTFSYTGPAYLNRTEIQEILKNAIMDNLTKKGVNYNDTAPDLLVDFHVTIEDEVVLRYHDQEDEPHYYKTPFSRTDEVHLTKGSIVVHMVDRQRGELVWESHTEGFFENQPDLSEKNIRSAIEKVLRNFPPKSD